MESEPCPAFWGIPLMAGGVLVGLVSTLSAASFSLFLGHRLPRIRLA
jgi:hypothetical protein